MVVSYEYDAWGKVYSVTGSLADTLGTINPIRYRSYYYDNETGFYYLNSRYYDPEVKRFINADGVIGANQDLTSYNLYAYCGNNPVIRKDSSGEFWLTALIVTAVVTVVAVAVTKAVCTIRETNRVEKEIQNIPEPTKDITESLTQTMQTNAKSIQDYRKDNGLIDSTFEFKRRVQNKVVWDLKQQDEYKGQSFKFNKIKVEAQDIGNIHYGYVGKAMGLPDIVLLAGGSYAQLRAGTSNFEMFMTTGGDDLRDQAFIMYGIRLYEEENK